MTEPIDFTGLICQDQIKGEDARETQELRAMLDAALDYLRGFTWCPPVKNVYMGLGIGGVIALFLVEFLQKAGGTDEYLWLVQGDLPSAYFVTDCASDPFSAIEVYCELMEDWAKAVLDGRSLDDVFPVAAAPTAEYAHMLLSRINFIREKILPEYTAK